MRYARIVGVLAGLLLAGCGSEGEVKNDPGRDGLNGGQNTGSETTPPTEDTDGGGGTGATGDDDDETAPGDDDDDVTPGDTGLTGDEICELAAALVIELDPYQTPDDGRVVYCHAGGGSNLHYIETDISACIPHLNHPGDVFPTTGCDS